jgi:hypothetical protein
MPSFGLRKVVNVRAVTLVILAIASGCHDSPTDSAQLPTRPSFSLAADSAGEYYYYQGDKVFLDVDPTRIVVVTRTPTVAAAALRGIGIATDRQERLPQASDHWLFRLSATTIAQAIDARASLKANGRYRFVSNVYKTHNSGDDVIPLNRVTVSFKPGVSSSQADSLITSFGMAV